MTDVIDVDVLVVGGGGAALRAALEALGAGARVALAVKGQLGAVGFRGGGATASGTAADRRGFWPVNRSGRVLESAFDDVLQLGLGMADPRLAQVVVEEAPSSLRVLESLGVPVSRVPRPLPGFLDYIVFSLVPALAAAVRRSGCAIHEHTMITGVSLLDGTCVGAVGIDEKTGQIKAFQAGSVILGTGGAAQLFKHHAHPACVTGDGYALGHRAGADLMNLEFMQFFLGTAFPTVNNLGNWVWGEDTRVFNAAGEEFLESYLPAGGTQVEARAQAVQHNPFSTRDSLSRYLGVALVKEVTAGHGTAHDGTFMDLTSPQVRVPEERADWLRYRGIRWDHQPVEVVMYAMCSNGGLRIDTNARTTVPGLYAVGECSAGAYGADRHAGNMMGASQVFGARAGRHAAFLSIGTKRPPIPAESIAEQQESIKARRQVRMPLKPVDVRKRLAEAAWRDLLVVRTDQGLRWFLGFLDELKRDLMPEVGIEQPRDLIEFLELENLLLVGEVMARAALMRTESRGGHYREDYPWQEDGHWLKSIVVRKASDGMRLHTETLHPEWISRPEDMRGEYWG